MEAKVRAHHSEAGGYAERHHGLASLPRNELLRRALNDVRPRTTGSAPIGARAFALPRPGAVRWPLGQSKGELRVLNGVASFWLPSGHIRRSVCLVKDEDLLEFSFANDVEETRCSRSSSFTP